MTTPGRLPDPYGSGGGANLADILERVLDKGIVIAGDIKINLLDIELLTIKLRLVASVDKAKEMDRLAEEPPGALFRSAPGRARPGERRAATAYRGALRGARPWSPWRRKSRERHQ
ncbi:Gas vesicle structural protein [Streptomyces alboniger]